MIDVIAGCASRLAMQLQALNHMPKEQHQEGSQLDKEFLLASGTGICGMCINFRASCFSDSTCAPWRLLHYSRDDVVTVGHSMLSSSTLTISGDEVPNGPS